MTQSNEEGKMKEPVFVYRVYTTEHSDKDSYVQEFGIYSTLEKAQARLKKVLEGYVKSQGTNLERWKWSETGHSCWLEGAWLGEEWTHYIDRLCVDEETNEQTTVHT